MTPARLLLLAVAAGCVYFQGAMTANPRSRYDQTVSIVAHGTLNIDRYAHNTVDWSLAGGHYYPNKPPGLALLATVPYAVLYGLERAAGLDPIDTASRTWRFNHAMLSAVMNGVPAALAAAMLFGLLVRLGARTRVAAAAVAACFLGTVLLPYATALYAHTHVAALLAMALCFALHPAPDRWPCVAAGVLCGLAVISDYTAAVPAIAVVALVGWERRSWRDVAACCAAAAPLAIALAAYHWACFGHPLATTYRGTNPIHLAPGGGLVSAPSPGRIAGLLFGPATGLFFYAPVLLLALPGVVFLWRGGRRPLALAAAVVPAAGLLINAMWYPWQGGSGTGPRLLSAVFPFLALALPPAIERWPRVAAVLGVASLLNAVAMAATDVTHPTDEANPLLNYVYRQLVDGSLYHDNLGRAIGLPGILSLIPLVIVWDAIASALRRRV